MAFRITMDGAMKGIKFETREEAIEAMWQFFKDKMPRSEFDQFIKSHIEEA